MEDPCLILLPERKHGKASGERGALRVLPQARAACRETETRGPLGTNKERKRLSA